MNSFKREHLYLNTVVNGTPFISILKEKCHSHSCHRGVLKSDGPVWGDDEVGGISFEVVGKHFDGGQEPHPRLVKDSFQGLWRLDPNFTPSTRNPTSGHQELTEQVPLRFWHEHLCLPSSSTLFPFQLPVHRLGQHRNDLVKDVSSQQNLVSDFCFIR